MKHLDGTQCVGQDDTLQRWHEHFELVLNINSSFDQNVFQSVEQHPLRSEMAEPPSEEEVIEALGKLNINEAPGKKRYSTRDGQGLWWRNADPHHGPLQHCLERGESPC